MPHHDPAALSLIHSETLSDPPSLRVLHICETAVGGVGTYISTLNRLMAEPSSADRQVISKVVLPQSHEDAIDQETPRRSFYHRRRGFVSLLCFARASLSERFRYRPHIIFCHSSFALLALILLRPISPRIKFIYCAHGWAGAREMDNHRKKSLVQKLEGWLCGLAHRVLNVSQGEYDFATKHGYRGCHVVIENAVWDRVKHEEHFAFEGPPDAINLLFVGRFDRQKGLDILLEAFVEARAINPALHLQVIGQSVRDRGKERFEEEPPIGVTFHGWIPADQIDRYYSAADLLVVPSRWEGFGLVIPEALRNGLPVLVSDRCAIADAIEPDISGWSCRLDVSALSKCLVALDKVRLKAMAPAARDLFLRRFYAPRLGREIMALYQALVPR